MALIISPAYGYKHTHFQAIVNKRYIVRGDVRHCSSSVVVDPYVKIWMVYDGKKVEKKKTIIHQKTLNPVFNETFTFAVPYERIRHTSLVISVMDHDPPRVT